MHQMHRGRELGAQQRLAPLGSYIRPMSPAEVLAFVHDEQQMWKPVLQQLALTRQ